MGSRNVKNTKKVREYDDVSTQNSYNNESRNNYSSKDELTSTRGRTTGRNIRPQHVVHEDHHFYHEFYPHVPPPPQMLYPEMLPPSPVIFNYEPPLPFGDFPAPRVKPITKFELHEFKNRYYN